MIYFTAHTFKCVCHCIRTMFRVLGVYNFDGSYNLLDKLFEEAVSRAKSINVMAVDPTARFLLVFTQSL